MLNSHRTFARHTITLILICGFLLTPAYGSAFWGTTTKQVVKHLPKLKKIEGALPEGQIDDLAKLSLKTKGVSKVGKVLGNKQLTQGVLEDTYMRILLKQGKISTPEAENMYRNLRSVEGFVATMRKVSGTNPMQLHGHMNELRIANASAKQGFKVMAIGKKWDDGIKKGLTDIDVLLSKNGKVLAIEAKHYASSTKVPIDKFRADMDTLVAFQKQSKAPCKPIFTITNKPDDPVTLAILDKEASKRGVELIYGSPTAQAIQFQLLGELS